MFQLFSNLNFKIYCNEKLINKRWVSLTCHLYFIFPYNIQKRIEIIPCDSRIRTTLYITKWMENSKNNFINFLTTSVTKKKNLERCVNENAFFQREVLPSNSLSAI